MVPNKIILHQKSNTLELGYKDNSFALPAAYMRAKSPSAEMKANPSAYNPHIRIEKVKLVGNYALQLYFDDGHNTGIYNWEYLRQISIEWKNQQLRQMQAQVKTEKAQPLHIREAKAKE